MRGSPPRIACVIRSALFRGEEGGPSSPYASPAALRAASASQRTRDLLHSLLSGAPRELRQNSLRTRRPAWESVLEEMGNPVVRAGCGAPHPESPARSVPPSFAGGRTLLPAPLPGGASRRVGQPAHEGPSPQPEKANRRENTRGEGQPDPDHAPDQVGFPFRQSLVKRRVRDGMAPQEARLLPGRRSRHPLIRVRLDQPLTNRFRPRSSGSHGLTSCLSWAGVGRLLQFFPPSPRSRAVSSVGRALAF